MSHHLTAAWRAALAFVLTACAKAPIPQQTERQSDAGMTALTQLMKNQINPAFSRLTFLVFHGEELQEDPNTVRSELEHTATVLRGAIGQLRDWREPPTQSTEGRDVFYAYAASVDRQAQELFDAIARRDGNTAAAQMQDIADTCNNCHHFFRLKIEDSVVPSR
jgi:hypothetical protein